MQRTRQRIGVLTNMENAMWKAALMDDRLMKYMIPGTLVMGGCLLFMTGYWMGSRKSKMQIMKHVHKEAVGSCMDPPESALSRVTSEPSITSPESVDSEKGSPIGDTYRCALIVRKDCGLGRGKIIIHCCRAYLAEFKKLYKQKDPDLKEWERDGMTVVVLRAESENDLTSLKAKSSEVNVPSHIFVSKQSDGTSLRTVMALGPTKSSLIKDLTQHLLRL